eukprot:5926814-Prymnesium_polylepis.1
MRSHLGRLHADPLLHVCASLPWRWQQLGRSGARKASTYVLADDKRLVQDPPILLPRRNLAKGLLAKIARLLVVACCAHGLDDVVAAVDAADFRQSHQHASGAGGLREA